MHFRIQAFGGRAGNGSIAGSRNRQPHRFHTFLSKAHRLTHNFKTMSKINTLLLLGLLCSLSVHAQPTQQVADTLQFDDIFVTASKIPTALRATTKPVLVIGQDIISRSAGKDISQLLSEQAGLLVNGAFSNPGKDKSLYVQGAASKYTLILVDGLAVNDPNGLGGASDLRNFSLDNVERIEIVKGSISTLYGTDAIAGVVNIVTKKPANTDVQLNGTASYGSYGNYKTAFGVSGSQNEGSYSINFSREGSGGISEAEDRDDVGGFDDDSFDRNALAVRTSIKPAEGLSISPFFNYTGFEGDYDSGSFTDGTETYESSLVNPGIQASYATGNFSVDAGYNYTSSEQIFNSAFGTSEFIGKLQNADIFATYQVNEYTKILGGVNYQNMEIGGDAIPTADILSPYLNALLTSWNGFSVEAGLRLNEHSEYGSNTTYSISGSYYIIPDVRVLVSYGTGFKAPTIAELFGPFGANPDLDPEESVYFNSGLEVYLLENRLTGSFNFFTRNIEDVIAFTGAGYINQDKQEDIGVETTLRFRVSDELSVSGSYTYLDGERTSVDFIGDPTTSDNLLRRPDHHIGLGLNFRPLPELSVSVNGEYVGERADLFFDLSDFSSTEVTLDAYTLINAYAEYQFLDGAVTTFVDIKNLFNTDYTEVYGFNTIGLAAQLGARFRL